MLLGILWVSVFVADCLGFWVDSLTGCLCVLTADGYITPYRRTLLLHCIAVFALCLCFLHCVASRVFLFLFFFAGRITSMGSDCGYRSTHDEKCRAVGVRSKQASKQASSSHERMIPILGYTAMGRVGQVNRRQETEEGNAALHHNPSLLLACCVVIYSDQWKGSPGGPSSRSSPFISSRHGSTPRQPMRTSATTSCEKKPSPPPAAVHQKTKAWKRVQSNQLKPPLLHYCTA